MWTALKPQFRELTRIVLLLLHSLISPIPIYPPLPIIYNILFLPIFLIPFRLTSYIIFSYTLLSYLPLLFTLFYPYNHSTYKINLILSLGYIVFRRLSKKETFFDGALPPSLPTTYSYGPELPLFCPFIAYPSFRSFLVFRTYSSFYKVLSLILISLFQPLSLPSSPTLSLLMGLKNMILHGPIRSFHKVFSGWYSSILPDPLVNIHRKGGTRKPSLWAPLSIPFFTSNTSLSIFRFPFMI